MLHFKDANSRNFTFAIFGPYATVSKMAFRLHFFKLKSTVTSLLSLMVVGHYILAILFEDIERCPHQY